MSQYFRTLRRLEADRATDREETRIRRHAAPPALPLETVAAATDLLSTEKQRAFADLLENLRARTHTSTLPRIVVAGVTAAESVADIVAGISSQAESQGLQPMSAELSVSRDHRILRPGTTATESSPKALDLSRAGMSSGETIDSWFGQVACHHDLLIIQAPPLTRTVDAALLAKRCDGLILVVEPRITPWQELKVSVERARETGCPILGLIMNRAVRWLPAWLERFFHRRSALGAFES